MKSLNSKRLKTLYERHRLLYQQLELSISNEAITRVLQAQYALLDDLTRQYEEGSRQKIIVKRQKDEKEKRLAEVKAELKTMKVKSA